VPSFVHERDRVGVRRGAAVAGKWWERLVEIFLGWLVTGVGGIYKERAALRTCADGLRQRGGRFAAFLLFSFFLVPTAYARGLLSFAPSGWGAAAAAGLMVRPGFGGSRGGSGGGGEWVGG
jgi:hypothetical protein